MNANAAPTDGNSEAALAHKLSLALEAAELGVWEWDLRTGEFDYSPRAKQIFGFAADEQVTRERIIGTMHPADHKLAREQAEQSLDPSLTRRLPYRYRIYRADTHELRWIHAFGEPIFDETSGQPVATRFVGTVQDVTDDVLAKERLAYQEARLRLAIEASGIAVWELDLATETIAPSPELNRLCGFPLDARPTLEEFRSRYAPGERERLERLGAEARARGETRMATEIHHIWPDGTERWLSLRAQLAPGEENYGGRIIGTLSDITEHKQHEERQKLLLSELKHRIKNSFAVTQAIISQTLREEEVSTDVRSKLFGRLQALAEAHEEIAGGAWDNASLLALIKRASSTFQARWNDRLIVEGDDITLSPPAALAYSLVFHELFTNATKYGALANDAGCIHLALVSTRQNGDDYFVLTWSERGGPRVSEPLRTGFGSRLLDRLLVADYGAVVQRDFQQEGFSCRIEVLRSKLVGH